MYDLITDWDNLLLAWRNASRGKRATPNVAAFEYRLEDNLVRIRNELKAKTWRPGGYIDFTIHEPKKRRISAAPFQDRVVHHALCNVIEPVFEKTFISDSYANRRGKGTHKAIDRCQVFARKYAYVLQCDLKQFFPSIDHEILREIIARRIHDPDVMWLVDRILDSGKDVLRNVYDMVFFPGDDMLVLCREWGLPIGNLTSQFWANVVLNPFDHFVKRELRCKGYLRYVDDFLVFADDKNALWQHAGRIKTRLTRYRLSMHPPCVRPVGEGIPFLGFVVFPDRRLLKRRKVVHFKRRFKRLVSAYESGAITADQFKTCVQSWVNHSRFGNTCALREKILSDRFFMTRIHQRRNYIVLKR